MVSMRGFKRAVLGQNEAKMSRRWPQKLSTYHADNGVVRPGFFFIRCWHWRLRIEEKRGDAGFNISKGANPVNAASKVPAPG